jgi:hypothetical protein
MTIYIQRGRPQQANRLASRSAAADFKAPDGMINFSTLVALNKKVGTALANAAKKGLDVKPTLYYIVPAKAKPIKYNEPAAKRKDPKYLSQRAIKLTERKRLNPAMAAKITVLLTVIEGKDVPKDLKAELRFALTAIKAHQEKVLKTKDVIKDIRSDLRDEKAANFAKAVSQVRSLLEKAGIKEASTVEATGMMGAASLLVKLDKDTVVSINLSDTTRFNKAKKDAGT